MPSLPASHALTVSKTSDHPAWAWMSQALSDRRAVMRWPNGQALQGYADGLLTQLSPCAPGSLGLVSWVRLTEKPLKPEDLLARLKSCAQALMDGGLLMAADLGPTSLTDLVNGLDPQSPEGRELAVWRAARLDLHDLGDALSAAGLAEPVMESESLTLTYQSEQTALDDLQALGLFLGQPVQAWSGALNRLRTPDGLLRLTLEVVIGHAWRMPSRKPKLDPHEPTPIRFAQRT
ncbi:MAG: hypothetical protein ACO21Q_05620 [Burkholderiaceae bacterium]